MVSYNHVTNKNLKERPVYLSGLFHLRKTFVIVRCIRVGEFREKYITVMST